MMFGMEEGKGTGAQALMRNEELNDGAGKKYTKKKPRISRITTDEDKLPQKIAKCAKVGEGKKGPR